MDLKRYLGSMISLQGSLKTRVHQEGPEVLEGVKMVTKGITRVDEEVQMLLEEVIVVTS